MLVTNEIRVMFKEKQLVLVTKWLKENPKLKGTKFYKTFEQLAKELPDSIEQFKGLATFDKRMEGRTSGPTIVRLNHVDEHLEDIIAKYELSEMLAPGQVPLRREITQTYKDVLAEMQKK